EVLKQIALEKSSSEIAEHLLVSIKTVETYRRSLYKKLNYLVSFTNPSQYILISSLTSLKLAITSLAVPLA
ncbi:MAG: LuxR C-terminal-related transcriptional regulator, partial [Flavobacteriales bacterium]